MTFKSLNIAHLTKFNSAISSDFLYDYINLWKEDITKHESEKPSQTFAPSSFRCKRISWFRLRGVDPDGASEPDLELDFSAEMGTACHRILQERISRMLGDKWLSPMQVLNETSSYVPFDIKDYSIISNDDNLEYKIEVLNPPIHFACDGLIHLNDTYFLLEIKTCDFNTWSNLTEPKSEHIIQVKCYCTMLGLKHVIMIYQDRQYGGLKCFELSFSDTELSCVVDTMKEILRCVNTNLAPEGLPIGDKWCNSNYCQYYKKCQEYGR